MDKFLKLLSIFKVCTDLAPVIASRVHTKADAVGLVCATLTNLVASGHIPASVPESVTQEDIADILVAHPAISLAPEIKTEVISPINIPVSSASAAQDDRLTRIEEALARLASTR